MRFVKISACQFAIERSRNFEDLEISAKRLLAQAPSDSHYLIFLELFTVGLLTSYRDIEKLGVADLVRIDDFTDEYRDFFSQLTIVRGQFIVAGSHLEEREEGFFNLAHIFTPDGRDLEHRKTHIFSVELQWQTLEGDCLEVWDLGPAKVGVAICYEAEIPEVSRILAQRGAEIILCPSFIFSEAGFWRVRHCAQARCLENQVFFTHCCTIRTPGAPLSDGFGRCSILNPCDTSWTPIDVVTEAETHRTMVITGTVDVDLLYENREKDAATTFRDRARRAPMYQKYEPYRVDGRSMSVGRSDGNKRTSPPA